MVPPTQVIADRNKLNEKLNIVIGDSIAVRSLPLSMDQTDYLAAIELGCDMYAF